MINERQARKFCKEDISKIKNYYKAIADTTQTWHCHHMTETWWGCTKKDLIENECYYNRKACELIFLTPAEHRRLHRKGEQHSVESRRKMSESKKGCIFSEEHRRNLSEARKGKHHSEETKQKMRESHKGRTFSEESRRKMSIAAKNRCKKNHI